MLLVDSIVKHLVKVDEHARYKDALSCFMALHHAIRAARKIDATSTQVLLDAEAVLTKLRSRFTFSYERLFTSFPALLFHNPYLTTYADSAVRPYEDQVQVVTHLRKHASLLCFVKTVPGSGKTTNVIAIAGEMERRKGTVLFVCTNKLVLEQVGRDAYNADVPFAVAANKQFRRHFNAKQRTPVLILSDLMSARDEIERHRRAVLFLDEPTIAAESENAINDKIAELLLVAPAQTVLSSATLPSPAELSIFVEHFKGRHSGAVVKQVLSNRVPISCTGIFQGRLIIPVTAPANSSALRKSVEALRASALRFRLLSIEVMLLLRRRLILETQPKRQHSSSSSPSSFYPSSFSSFSSCLKSLEEVFPDPSTVGHAAIAEYALELLLLLADMADATPDGGSAMIQRVCAPVVEQTYRPHCEDKLLTSLAHLYLRGTLVATPSPIDTAQACSKALLGNQSHGSEAIRQAKKEHEKDLAAYQREVQKLQKSIKNQDDLSCMLAKLSSPVLQVPEALVPNSSSHMARYASAEKVRENRDQQAISLYPPWSVADGLHEQDWLLDLLRVGVAVYAPNSSLTEAYTDAVVTLCQSGNISFLFADRSIVYGTNFPFSNIIVSKAFAQSSSLNTLYQLMGRAGRVGRSYSARVVLEDPNTLKRVVQADECNQEAATFRTAFQRCLPYTETKSSPNK